jgi:hypothetical protein
MNFSVNDSLRTVDLEKGQLIVVRDRPGTRVQVLSGGVWLTEEGRGGDRFAQAGGEIRLARRGRAVVEALQRSRVSISEPTRPWPRALAEGVAARAHDPVWARGLSFALALVVAFGVPELLARAFLHA